jgi:hypothetical protein
MNGITVTTQAELDALPKSFDEFTYIYIKATARIVVRSARENSSVEAWGNSSVEARENSSVEAWGNSSVEAWENSSVEARENSSVVARENSSVEARENSSVEAWGNSCIRIQSEDCSVALWAFSVAYLLTKKAKAALKSKTATIIKPVKSEGVEGWLEAEGIKPSKSVILFKRVSSDFKTQEREPNETLWTVGTTLTHPSWNPKESECGSGKYHACSRPYFCDEFRTIKGDRYIAIEIKKKDLYAWPNAQYPHKIAFMAGTVLYECDRFGKQKV